MRSAACLIALLVSVPASAAHPLTVDDAGTIDPASIELELSSAVADPEFGPSHGVGVAARVGLLGSLDSGLGMIWFDSVDGDSGYELAVDLKFAPGSASGWRPRPFLRSDFALASVLGTTDTSFAALSGGLTWEIGRTVVTGEASWSEPLDSDLAMASAWSIAGGVFLPLHHRATLAAELRRGEWGDHRTDVVRVGALTPLGSGNLSFGAELPIATARFETVVLLFGWTAEFGL
jgi:hypothetical protein